MNTMIKVEYILVIIQCLLSGIYSDDNLNCQYLDFNKIDSVSKLEQCPSGGNVFTIQSYSDGSLNPYRDDFIHYLTNSVPTLSCFTTVDYFTFDANTKFNSAIYLQSSVVGDTSFVEISIVSMDGSTFPITIAGPTFEDHWQEFSNGVRPSENVKVVIRAEIMEEATLAIQYLHFANSDLEDPQCHEDTATTTESTTTDTTTENTTTDDTTTENTTTDDTTTTESTTTDTTTENTTTDDTTTTESTTTDTTTESTTTDTTTETTTTDRTTITTPSPPSDSNNVWMIISFVFFLATIIVAVGSIYLIYLYKTTLAMNTTLMAASTAKSTLTALPRLTVATSNYGNQVIVGIENVKQI